MQAAGLIGSNGILPMVDFLPAVHGAYGRAGYWMVPTLFWISSSDVFLRAIWMTGAGFALLVVGGLNHRFSRLMLFLLYLSLVAAGQVFMGFQWDALLLEAGFLAIFLSSSGTIKWLFRWLLFRLMFLSGSVKLLSGDPTWRDFTALTYHYQTQPLPTPLAWYMQQLPRWFQRASVGAMFFVELAVPFLIFAPRRARLTAALMITGFQTLIFLTGNYTFFNLLTIALCLFLVDDTWLARLLPGRAAGRIASWMRPHNRFPLRGPVTAALAGFVLLLSGSQLLNEFFHVDLPAMGTVESAVAPFELVNSYGLFAVMTTTRPEIVIEGSNDGNVWQEYEFKYKPGNVYRRPRWVEPFQPRLDWQMWFAALGNYQNNPWVLNLMVRLLQEKPDVTGLLDRNPFPGTPPRYMRALVYQYRFTTAAERAATGAWWQRQLEGSYTPVISLRR